MVDDNRAIGRLPITKIVNNSGGSIPEIRFANASYTQLSFSIVISTQTNFARTVSGTHE
jgi:hypothetical protein